LGDNRFVELNDIEELKSLINDSSRSPLVIFKHSITCPISMNAYSEMKQFLAQNAEEATLRIIVVQRSRAVSDAVARELGLGHESPQVILVRNGRVVWHESHYDVTSENLLDAINDPG
jgi:bacillithiol system protein YtxJ